MSTVTLLAGDCRTILPTLDAGSVHCCVCSPPYWNLRDYGVDGQLGLERTPDEYVANMVAVFREVWRVLRDDGTVWCNLGDSYAANWNSRRDEGGGGFKAVARERNKYPPEGLKPKDLCGIPWRVAFALQADGWYLRSDIIWSKPNPMPESVTDRPTKSHEYLFLLVKSERYYYDATAICEAVTGNAHSRGNGVNPKAVAQGLGIKQNESFSAAVSGLVSNRNRRSVWRIATAPYSGAHFATYPPALVEPCILAGTSAKGCCAQCGAPWERVVAHTPMVIDRSDRTHELGRTRSSGTMLQPAISKTTGWQPTCEHDAEVVPCTVLDPFTGSGTTGEVAVKNGRSFVGIELSPAYLELARVRIGNAPLSLGLGA